MGCRYGRRGVGSRGRNSDPDYKSGYGPQLRSNWTSEFRASATNASGMGLIAGAGVRQLVESSGPAAIQIASGGTTNPAYIFMGINGDPDATRIASQVGFTQISATGASDYLRFDAGGLNERMRVTSAGNVGIGTTTPTTALDVNGTANATTLSIGGTAITATAAELNYVDGVTSNIQAQINALSGGGGGGFEQTFMLMGG